MKKLKELSLRERKYAQTKVSLLRATLERLKTKRLSDISVRELCDEVFISEATFFNYFSKKSDLLVYYIKLWSLEMQWHIENENLSGFEAIERIFMQTSEEKILIGNFGVMDEINGFFALSEQMIHDIDLNIGLAEKLMVFSELEGIDNTEELELSQMIQDNLIKAIELGDLPAKTNIDLAIHSIMASFFGIRMTSRLNQPGTLSELYAENLKLIWAGLKARY
jgi:AcrR family transcriptional regulator